MTVVRVAACQLALDSGDGPGNRAAAESAVRAAAGTGATLVVLPELANSGYVFASREQAWALAEPPDGPTVSGWAALAAELGVVVVGGFCEAGPAGQIFNAAAVVTPEGVAATYRKVHLWDREPEIFTAGTGRPPVVATAAGRIGVVVCYDLEFPEWAVLPALEDADLLCVPTAWPQPVSAVPPGERSLEILRAQAAAAAGCCWVVVADRCGTERGARWQGASMVVGPDGYPVTRPPHAGPGVIVADCDLGAAAAARHAPAGHVLADRRIAPALAPGRIVDLSVVLDEHTQVFPGDPEPVIRPATTIAEQGFNVLHVAMGSQTGTHVDAPYHVREDGLRIDELPLERFVGPAVVADLRGRPPRTRIGWADLAAVHDRLRPGAVLLLMTGWDSRWGTPDYFEHPSLDPATAEQVVAAGVRTIGIDAPNLDETLLDVAGPVALPAHQPFARAAGIIVENLRGLDRICPGDLVSVAPLRLAGADGAPCRAYAFGPPVTAIARHFTPATHGGEHADTPARSTVGDSYQ